MVFWLIALFKCIHTWSYYFDIIAATIQPERKNINTLMFSILCFCKDANLCSRFANSDRCGSVQLLWCHLTKLILWKKIKADTALKSSAKTMLFFCSNGSCWHIGLPLCAATIKVVPWRGCCNCDMANTKIYLQCTWHTEETGWN